jgi:alkanesulfonate monooxygenase SsuD/methylene tetrahydromethanopterin reductase-like flavin-dependent oxidoreductase (luciferase family)
MLQRMATGCFVSTGRTLQDAIERVKLAESLGYESAFVTHIAGRESLTVVTAYALATSKIRVGPGVVPIYTRTPATMAQTAATIDELSGGRLTLGLGVSHRPVVEGWHGQTIDKPVAEMREYASIVRAILRGEDPPRGEKWQTGFHLMGIEAAAGRGDRRRRPALAMQPAVHTGRRDPRGHCRSRTSGPDARGL